MDIIEKAVKVLQHDGLVIYPTDTVYGLGADAFSDEAIEKVYEAKGRMAGKPVSLAVSDREMLSLVARVDERADAFIAEFLPGPVTVVLEARSVVPSVLTGGTGLIGVRIPSHVVPVSIIEKFDAPITATSANRSGGRDPVIPGDCNVTHDLLIDGGRLPGTPSTVVDLTTGTILREGAAGRNVREFLSGTDRPCL
jgi:L-threonylcarbamoyladenylate synthase